MISRCIKHSYHSTIKIQLSYSVYIYGLKSWSRLQYTYLFPFILFSVKGNNVPTLTTTKQRDLHKRPLVCAFEFTHILMPLYQHKYNLQHLKTHIRTQTHTCAHRLTHTHIYVRTQKHSVADSKFRSSLFDGSCQRYMLQQRLTLTLTLAIQRTHDNKP